MRLILTIVLTLLVSTAEHVRIKSTTTSVPGKYQTFSPFLVVVNFTISPLVARRSSRERTVSTGLMTVRRIHVSSELALMEATATSVSASQDTTEPTATRTLTIVRRLVRSLLDVRWTLTSL